MERLVTGDVVILPFPFSDLTHTKKRPAVVLGTPTAQDIILCAITSTKRNDGYDVVITKQDFTHGQLRRQSSVRAHRIFTADKNIILYKAGNLNKKTMAHIEDKVVAIKKKTAFLNS